MAGLRHHRYRVAVGMPRQVKILLAGLVLAASAACAPDRSMAIAEPPPEEGEVTVVPAGEPAATYHSGAVDRAAGPLAAALEASLPGVVASSCLERAAGEFARIPFEVSVQLPVAAPEFLIHWAGCVDATVAIIVVESPGDHPGALLASVADSLPGELFTHAGIGSVPLAGVDGRRWAAFLSRRRAEVRALPKRAAPGEMIEVRFRLEEGLQHPRIVSTLPTGETLRVAAMASGGDLVAWVPASDAPGEQWIELVVDGDHGAEMLSLFPVAVGLEPARSWSGSLVEDEGGVEPGDAERMLHELVNEARTEAGLEGLRWDDRLAAIAREHSSEMAAADFFGHTSPTRGGPDDRLREAGYEAASSGENVARGISLSDLHHGLMRSPGHRANLLGPEFTSVGIGVVVAQGVHGGLEWVVTQAFARPAAGGEPITVADAAH
jgi:hypothetical protein